MKMKFILFVGVFFGLVSLAQSPSSDPWEGRPEMNGFTYKDFNGFEQKWKFVTSRYRKDTGEFRVVYANPLAWKTLVSNGKEFPDGAMFAKIGYGLADDPIFPSSLVPDKIRRYQFMVRDHRKYKDTDG
jgi:hypothetical protein